MKLEKFIVHSSMFTVRVRRSGSQFGVQGSRFRERRTLTVDPEPGTPNLERRTSNAEPRTPNLEP
jgi:hypothetical protein